MDENEPLQPSRTAFASRFFNQMHHFKKLLIKYWWIPLLTIGAGEGIQMLLQKHQPQAFVSEGKMIVNVKLSIPNANVYSEEFNNFFGTQVALMQIRSVVDSVNQQLQSTKPDLHRVPVNIEVTLSPKTSIFNLQAVGADPSYVQAYLQETMDEYIKLKKNLLSNATTATQSTMQEELKQIAVQLENSKLDLINYQSSNSVVLLQPAGGNSAADRLAGLTKELAEDRSELQLEQTLTLDQNLERMQGAFPPENFTAEKHPTSFQVQLRRFLALTGANPHPRSKFGTDTGCFSAVKFSGGKAPCVRSKFLIEGEVCSSCNAASSLVKPARTVRVATGANPSPSIKIWNRYGVLSRRRILRRKSTLHGSA